MNKIEKLEAALAEEQAKLAEAEAALAAWDVENEGRRQALAAAVMDANRASAAAHEVVLAVHTTLCGPVRMRVEAWLRTKLALPEGELGAVMVKPWRRGRRGYSAEKIKRPLEYTVTMLANEIIEAQGLLQRPEYVEAVAARDAARTTSHECWREQNTLDRARGALASVVRTHQTNIGAYSYDLSLARVRAAEPKPEPSPAEVVAAQKAEAARAEKQREFLRKLLANDPKAVIAEIEGAS